MFDGNQKTIKNLVEKGCRKATVSLAERRKDEIEVLGALVKKKLCNKTSSMERRAKTFAKNERDNAAAAAEREVRRS